MRTFRRVEIGLGATVLVLVALVAAMFAFGRPVAPRVTPQQATPGGTADGGAEPSAALQPAPPSGPLAIEVPGCVCHSDDPQVVAEHATYRMSQCFDCHQGGTPQMGGK